MTKTPSDMSTLWVRDEDGDLRELVKQGARRKGQKVADYLRAIIDRDLNDDPASHLASRGGKPCQSGRQD